MVAKPPRGAAGRMQVNPACAALMEADGPQALLGRSFLDSVHPLDQTRSVHRVSSLSEPDLPNTPTKLRACTCRGSLRMLLITSTAIEHQGAAARERTQFSAAVRQHARRVLPHQRRGRGGQRWPAVRRVLGQEPEEIIGSEAEAWYPDAADRDAFKRAVLAHGEVTDFPGQMVGKDGRFIDISISSRALRDAQGNFAGVERLWRDVTQRKNLERKLQRMEHIEMLTGIANRRAFLEHAESCPARFRRDGIWFALLMMLDLDHFKAINDRFGHHEGDRVLVDFARKVSSHIAGTDMLGMLGGEEFGVVLYRPTEQESVRAALHLLREVAQLPLPRD